MSTDAKPSEAEAQAPKNDAAAPVSDKGTDDAGKLNTVCELKDTVRTDTAPVLSPISTPDLLAKLTQAKTVSLKDENQCKSPSEVLAARAEFPQSKATLRIQDRSVAETRQETRRLPDETVIKAELSEDSRRIAEETLKTIDKLLPPLMFGKYVRNGRAYNVPEPISMEDEKKLRAIFATASDAELKALNSLSSESLTARFERDPRLSQATRETLKILIQSPNRGDDVAGKIAGIALKHSNAELFNEAMSQAGRTKRLEFTQDDVLKAFPDRNSREFITASQYLEQGRANPFKQIEANFGKVSDNRDGIKLAFSKLTAEDLETYKRGKKLAEAGSTLVTKTEEMSKDELALYELGAKLQKGKIVEGLTPAQEQEALDRYRDVEALKTFSTLESKASWSRSYMAELDAKANYPDGKLATSIADLRTWVMGAPAVREVAKVIRDMTPEDKKFYKENPDRQQDIDKVLQELRLSPNDAMALQRYFKFFVADSISTAERALYRQPVLTALKTMGKSGRDMDTVVSVIQNMTEAEIARYKSEPKFREELRAAVRGDDPDPSTVAYRNREKMGLLRGPIALRLLDKIEQNQAPTPDLITKLQINAIKRERDSQTVLKEIQTALAEPTLRAKLQSKAPEDQAFISTFKKAAELNVGTWRYNDIIEPTIANGSPPLESILNYGAGYWSTSPDVFESIAAAPEATRKAFAKNADLMSSLNAELRPIALRVAQEGKFTDADRLILGLNNTFSGTELVIKTLEKVSTDPKAVAALKADFKKAQPDQSLESMLKDKLSPLEFARAKFILTESASEREKYLTTLDLFHSSIKGWGSRWTESVFGSETRAQTLAAMNDFTAAEVARAGQDIKDAVANDKVRQAVWKAIENHLTTRSDLMMYGGDAAGLGVPAAGAFAAYMLGAEVTVPISAILVMGGVLSRMGVRQGALGDFYDTRTKNLIIDTITSTVLSATAFLGPGEIANLLKMGERAGTQAATSTQRILTAIESPGNSLNLIPKSELERILAADSQDIVKRAMLGANKSFDERLIMSTAEKVVAKEGFTSISARQETVNQVFNALKTSLEQSYSVEAGAFVRYGRAAGLDLAAGSTAGGTASVIDDLLHGKELGLHNLLASLQAALLAGTLGTAFRGAAQLRTRSGGAKESPVEAGPKGEKVNGSETVHEYKAQTQNGVGAEVKVSPDHRTIEVKSKNGETIRKFDFDTDTSGTTSIRPKEITVGEGTEKFTIKAVAENPKLWRIERNGQVTELQAEITVNPKDGSYTVNYVTDETASWFKTAYKDGQPPADLVRKVTYHADGRVRYEGPTQNNWYPQEGSIFWKEAPQGEFWKSPDGKKTWITADNRIYREVFDNFFQASDSMFMEGKEAIKIREVKASELESDVQWINEGDTKWFDSKGQLRREFQGPDGNIRPDLIDPSTGRLKGGDAPEIYKAGAFVKRHTGRLDFHIIENGQIKKVDYYLVPAEEFKRTHRLLSGTTDTFIKTEKMVVRQITASEGSVKLSSDGAEQIFEPGDYLVISDPSKIRGIKKAEYEKLYVDAPSKSIGNDGFTLPPLEGPTILNPETGIASARWVQRVDGRPVDQGVIYWHNKEGIIRVVGENETRVYNIASATSKGYRFYWADGSAEYVNPEGLRFTKKPGDKEWTGEDGAKLFEAPKSDLLVEGQFDPSQHIKLSDNKAASNLGLTDSERFHGASSQATQQTLPDGRVRVTKLLGDNSTVVVQEGPVTFVRTNEGTYKIEDGASWFLDTNNILWKSNLPLTLTDQALVLPAQIKFTSVGATETYTYTRNIHGQFWDFASSGAKWIDSSGKTWTRRPGDAEKRWVGEDGSLYLEGNWQYTPRSKHDARRAVQGASALGVLASLSRAASADELQKQGGLAEQIRRIREAGLELPQELLREVFKAAGRQAYDSVTQALKIAPYLVAGTEAQYHLRQMLYEANQRRASNLRPEGADEQKPDLSGKETKAAEIPAAPEIASGKLSDAAIDRISRALEGYTPLRGDERLRAEYVQQQLLENLGLYHKVDPSKAKGNTEAELKADYNRIVKQSTEELISAILIEKKRGIFGPASRTAYNEFMKWAQTEKGPALRRQIQEWQANVTPGQARSLIDEATGKTMSQQLYLAKLLAGELKEEGLLKADERSISLNNLTKFDTVMNNLLDMSNQVQLQRLQNREFLLKQVIEKAGLPKEWLRKDGEVLPEYLERVEKFVQLATATRSTIDRLLDLWKRSNPPEFDFSLPPGATIRMKGSNLKITNENLNTPEIQKLLREKNVELVDMGMSPELRWDHPPGAVQRTLDWLKVAKERTDKIEPILDEIRKNPERIIMFQDKPIIGQVVKLDANNRFAGLVSPDAKPENPGEIITKEAGLLSYDYKVEKIASGPDAGRYRVTQTIQAYTAPPLAYQDIRALGMQPVGEATVVSEKIYSADDKVPIMSGDQVSYLKVSELENHRLLEKISYYGHKTLTGAFDLSIAGSLKATAGGIEAVKAMSAVELAASTRIAAARSINLTAKDTALQYSWWGARATALGLAPLNSTGGQLYKYNDMQVGAWINEGRGVFYLAEMGVGGLKMGYQKFLHSKYSGALGAKEAARIESGRLTGTEKIQTTMQADLPELMKEMKRLERLNNVLQAPMFLSLGSDIYGIEFGKKYDPVADASSNEEQTAHAQIAKAQGQTLPESKLPKAPGAEPSFKELTEDLISSLKPTATPERMQYLSDLIARVDKVLKDPEDKASLEKIKVELLSNLVFSGREIRDLEQVHPQSSPGKPFKLSSKDIVALLDPDQRRNYPVSVQELASRIIQERNKDVSTISRIALLKLSRTTGGEIEGEIKIPAPAAQANERSEKITLSAIQIARDLLQSSPATDKSQPSLLISHELYLSGKISANQMGAIYQDVLDNPNSTYKEKLIAINGFKGDGLAWVIETMRNPSDPLSAAQFNSYKMSAGDFTAALEKFAKSQNQPEELRALAAAQLNILARNSELVEKTRAKQAGVDKVLTERAAALKSLHEEFKQRKGDESSIDETYLILQREKLLSEINNAVPNESKESQWKRLNAANSLLLLTTDTDHGSKDIETEKLALKAMAASFNSNDQELAAAVLKSLTQDRLKRLEELDKPAADLLRRQTLNLLTTQSKGGDEIEAVQILEQAKRIFSGTDALTQNNFKNTLLSFIKASPDNGNYADKQPALRAKAIDALAEMGAADAADIIREHAGASASFSRGGTSFKFVEADAQVRLSAIAALEKLNPLVPQDRKLENYLSNLLTLESDPVVSASMELVSKRLGLPNVESKLQDSMERTLAILMLQTVNDKLNTERGKKGWSDDANTTNVWLKTNFDHLSREGLIKAAAANAAELSTTDYLTRSKSGVQKEQSTRLLDTMTRQFDELVDLAAGQDDLSNMAKRALYDIMTSKVLVPGTESNPIVLTGTYRMTLQSSINWQLKAAEALSKIASKESSYKDISNMFLLDGLIESRDPKVAAQIIKGLEGLAETQSARTSAFVSHRLDEFLEHKQVKEGLSGEFVAQLLQFANRLNTHNSLSELEEIRRSSPYNEVRQEAHKLILAKLDPIAADLKIPVDQTVETGRKIENLRDSLAKGETDRIAIAIRNLSGSDLTAAAAELQSALNTDDPRIKLLAADLILSSSSLRLEDPLLLAAIKQTATLRFQENPAAFQSKDQIDSIRLRADETLNKTLRFLAEDQPLSMKLDSGKVVTINRVAERVVVSADGLESKSLGNPVESIKHGAEISAEQQRAWLKASYPLLTIEGANKYASDNAGVLKKLTSSEASLTQEEKKALLRAMNNQFGKLADKARENGEEGQRARETLYAIMSEKLAVPGSKKNPLLASGSYPITIDDQNWPDKAAEILSRIAKGEGAGAEQASSFLLEGLLESRNPEVTNSIVAGIENLANLQPARTKALVSHRLSEYLELKEMKEGVQGSFIAKLLEFSYKLDDQSVLGKLALLREKSPYPEVREKARDLMIQNLDPLKNDLNIARTALKSPESDGALLSDLRNRLRESKDSNSIAEVLRSLQGKDLRSFMPELSNALKNSDPRIKLLSARLILDSKSSIPITDAVSQEALREVATLSLLNSADAGEQDRILSLRRQSMDTLSLIRERLRQGEVLRLSSSDSSATPIELRKSDGYLEVLRLGNAPGQIEAVTYSDGRNIQARMESGKLIVSRNGIEYVEAKVNKAGYWKELKTGLVILTPPDKHFTRDMEMHWRKRK